MLARDEERNLAELLPTLDWGDELLVCVNAESTDGSAAVARQLGARVEVWPFTNFARYRNQALAAATQQWILFVDADERVSPALAAEVRGVTETAASTGYVGGWVPRRNIILGHPMRAAGWYPDYQLRLLERAHAHYDESRPVHETVVLDGPVSYLREPFVHLNYQTVGQFVTKQRRYTALEAAELLAEQGRPRARALVGQPLREFWRRYVQLEGWRDGWVGLFLSLAMAFYAFERNRLARSSTPPVLATG